MNKKFWKNRNVFITGATGLLGSWITKYLTDFEANLVLLIHSEVPKIFKETFSKATILKGDVTNYDYILKTLERYSIETVFPLAAQTISPVANKNPLDTFETNIKGAWVTLEACRNAPLVKRIVFPSSDKAYGEEESLPYTEESKLNAKRPYTVSKSCADLIAQAYFTSYRLPVCITRCGNFFGGMDLHFDRLVPSVIQSVIQNKPITIRSDGKYIRDFIYVEDGAKASLLVAESMDDLKILGESFNFSYEIPITVLGLVELILKKMKSNINPEVLGLSLNEVRDQYLSSKKARKILGWKPIFNLDKGLDLTIDWYKEYFKNRRI